MSPVAFLDANVPIYAAGRPHPLKQPCAEILLLAAEQPQAFLTDAEVLQELLHRYLALRLWPQGREVFQRFAELMRDRVAVVQAADVERAADLANTRPELGGRDLLHAAVMERLHLRHIISADTGFDRLPAIERLDPAHVHAWRNVVLR
ncbi:MAG: type II toxin-antitoxin system VapC family toxin [Chloroflexi bacterium]|nr:type II toxin-antitoxin system VapC family toxin [Chloroflexota bacterium]